MIDVGGYSMAIEFRQGDGVEEELLVLVQNDRGNWSLGLSFYAGLEFVGFNRESTLVIVPMSKQSGMWDVVVVYSQVDSNSVVGRAADCSLAVAVNTAVWQVYR